MRSLTLLVLLVLSSFTYSHAQDYYDNLKSFYDSLRSKGTINEALPITKAMNQWAYENEGDTSLRYAVSFRYIGNCFENPDSALKYYNLSKLILEKQKREKQADYAYILHNLGLAYHKIGDYELAESYYQEALKIEIKALGIEHPFYINTMNSLGLCYKEKGDFKSAVPYYLQVLEYQKKTLGMENLNYAETLFNLGLCYSGMGEYKLAEPYQLEALTIRKNVFGTEHPVYIISLINLGACYYMMGDYKAAITYYLEVLEISNKLLGKEHPVYSDCLNNLGHCYAGIGDYKTAETYFLQALSIRNITLGTAHPAYAKSLSNLCMLYTGMGNYPKAELFCLQALETQKRLEDVEDPNYISSFDDLGFFYYSVGDYKAAELYYLQGLEISKKALRTNNPDYAAILEHLGLLYYIIGNYKVAETYYEETLGVQQYLHGTDHPDNAFILEQLGDCSSRMGEFKKAESYYLQAKRLIGTEHPDNAAILTRLGHCYYKMGDYNSAETNYQKGLEFIENLKENQYVEYEINQSHLGYLYALKGDYKSALLDYNVMLENSADKIQSTFTTFSVEQKKLFWKTQYWLYEYLPSFSTMVIDTEPSAGAISYNGSILAKGLLLDDNRGLQLAINSSNDTLLQKNFRTLGQLRQTLVNAQGRSNSDNAYIHALQGEVDSLDKIITGQVGEYAAMKRRFELRWTDVRQSLREDEAAIEFSRYYDNKDTSYKFMAQVVRRGYEYPKIVVLCAEKNLPSSNFSDSLSNLYKLVWQPLDTLLSGVTTVYYSPDGRLYSVPFNALCSNDSTGCTYLMDQYTLHRLSSTRYLADGSLIKTKDLNGTIALFGGIQYDVVPDSIGNKKEESNDDFLLAVNLKREITRGTMAYLPGTKAEVEGIAKMCHDQKWTTTVSTGAQASETSFKSMSNSSSPSIIHIATHGFAFPDKEEKKQDRLGGMMMSTGAGQLQYNESENPMLRCGLLFAGANISWSGRQQEMLDKTGDDGILTAAEVAALDLSNTKLVVLSACETGLGKIEGSEGVFGLQRGFKLAGVEQLIVSLWSVPDKETAQMMESFYSDLAITRDPVQSFAKAQKEMRNRFPDNPEKWAGFVLVR